MDKITSKSNEKVKYIKSLNDKKYRQKYDMFYIEGIKVIEEIMKSKKAIDIMFIAYSKDILINLNGGKELLNKLKKIKNISIYELSKEVFEYVVETKTPQGVLAVVKKNNSQYKDINKEDSIIILDRLQDLRKYWNNNTKC